MKAPLDLRLLPMASGLWLGCVIGLHTALHVVVIPALISVAAISLALRRRSGRVTAWGIAIALGIIVAALRVDAASPAPVEAAIANSGAVSFEAVVTAEPQAIERRAYGGLETERLTLARVTLVRVVTRHGTWHASVPATLQWPSAREMPAVGSRIAGEAVLHRDDPASGSSYGVSLRESPRIVAPPSRGSWLATRVRHGLALATSSDTGGDGEALLPGLVLGDTRAQSSALVDNLRASGLSHLTAVSGANLAIVISALMWVLRRTRIPSQHRHGLVLASIGAFVVVVQPQPSVLRAAVMGGIAVFAMMTGERGASASILWVSVLVLLVVDPFLAWQYGFALSVAATAGLIVLRPFLVPHLPGGWLGDALVVTVSAQLATWPLLLSMGRPPTWVSIPANLVCEPMVAPATVFGFIAAMLAALALIPIPLISWAAMHAAALVAMPGVWLATLIARVAGIGASSSLAIAPITALWQLVLLVFVLGVLRRIGMPSRALIWITVTALALSSCAPQVLHRWPQSGWWYAMCDVGQGDATVFSLGSGRAVVIDAGPDPALMRSCLRRLHIRVVDALFITHFHADHVEGMRGIVQQATVHHVYTTTLHEPSSEWMRVRQVLPVPMVDVRQGDVMRIASTTITVLWPVPDALDGTPNNGSLVLDVARSGQHVLVTGDADAAAQQALRLPIRGYGVLKVPHHGSRYQDPDFVSRAAPVLALVSVGEGNDYGHPALQTLDTLRRAGVRTLRTDQVGSIAVSIEHGRLRYVTSSG